MQEVDLVIPQSAVSERFYPEREPMLMYGNSDRFHLMLNMADGNLYFCVLIVHSCIFTAQYQMHYYSVITFWLISFIKLGARQI